jgi:hypothetical protein
MDDSMKILNDLKISHVNRMKLKSRRLPGHENVIDIDSHLKTSATVILNTKYIKDTDDIQMLSF